MWVFVLTTSFPSITGLNEAEESRNEDVDFKEKYKWKFIKSQIVLLPVMKLFREFEVIDIFYQQASTVLIIHLHFSTLILPVVIYKNES